MTHKYQHIKTMRQLDDEIQIANIRTQLLREELGKSYGRIWSGFNIGSGILKTITGIVLPTKGLKNFKGTGSTFEKILSYATKFGGLLALLRTLKRS